MDFIAAYFLAFYIVTALMTCLQIRAYKGGEDL
jgi:hypothetical protein